MGCWGVLANLPSGTVFKLVLSTTAKTAWHKLFCDLCVHCKFIVSKYRKLLLKKSQQNRNDLKP